MDNYTLHTEQKQENVVAGTLGALLFSLAGGVLWFVLYRVGYIAAISGIVAVFCAIKGYSLFAKKESVKGVIISLICSLLVIVLAWYVSIGYDVYNTLKEMYTEGAIDFEPDLFNCIKNTYVFFEDTEFLFACLKDLALGLLFCIAGCISTVKAAIKKANTPAPAVAAENTEQPDQAPEETTEE